MRQRRHSTLAITAGAALAGLAITTIGAGHAAARPAGAAPAIKTARPAYGEIAVAESGSIALFAPGAHGDATPIGAISGPATHLSEPYAVVFDSSGDIWTADISASAVYEFPAGMSGNVAPIRTIPNDPPFVDEPDGIALTPDGRHVWIGNDDGHHTWLAEFSTAASGGNAPTRRIHGSKTGITWSHDVSLSPDGSRLFEADAGTSTIRAFSTTGPTNQKPSRVITAGDSGSYIEGVAVSVFGDVWATDTNEYKLEDFTTSNTAPHHTVAGPTSGLDGAPSYVSFDAAGNVWIVTGGQNSAVPAISRFSRTANGDVSPNRSIAGADTGLSSPTDAAVFGSRPSGPRSLKAHAAGKKVHLSWKRPKHTHGGLIGYVVLRRGSKHGAFKTLAAPTTPKYVDRHRNPHHTYRYEVVAYNGYGGSGPSNNVTVHRQKRRHHVS